MRETRLQADYRRLLQRCERAGYGSHIADVALLARSADLPRQCVEAYRLAQCRADMTLDQVINELIELWFWVNDRAALEAPPPDRTRGKYKRREMRA